MATVVVLQKVPDEVLAAAVLAFPYATMGGLLASSPRMSFNEIDRLSKFASVAAPKVDFIFFVTLMDHWRARHGQEERA